MSSNDSMESILRKLRYRTTAVRREETLQNIYHAMDESQEHDPATGRVQIGRMTMSARTVRFALAAAVILVVLGGVTFWPFGNGGQSQWWLAPSAAWGQEILAALDAARVVTCREQTVFMEPDGSEHTSKNWHTFYVSKDSYRRDIYDGQDLREIQWYVPDGDGMLQHYVRYDLRCYGAKHHQGRWAISDPVVWLRVLAGQLDKADRLLGEEVIEGRDCVGFEIRASQYGNNPDTWIDRIWLDTQTKLPVRIEQSGRDPTHPRTTIMDQFVYDAQLPADTFLPQPPPEGFINVHPDDLRR
jgi:hypothetical protein